MKKYVGTVACLLAGVSLADDRLWVTLKPGIALQVESELKVLDDKGVALATTRGRGVSRPVYGVELRKSLRGPLFFAGTVDYALVGPADDPTPDSVISALGMLGVQNSSPYRFWGGLAIGPSLYTHGTTGITQGTTTIAIESSSLGLTAVPQVGFDLPLNEISLGLGLAFWTAEFDSAATVSTGSGTAKLTFNEAPTAYILSVRIGFPTGEQETPSPAAAPAAPTAPAPSPSPTAII